MNRARPERSKTPVAEVLYYELSTGTYSLHGSICSTADKKNRIPFFLSVSVIFCEITVGLLVKLKSIFLVENIGEKLLSSASVIRIQLWKSMALSSHMAYSLQCFLVLVSNMMCLWALLAQAFRPAAMLPHS